ncbi:MAG TPA: ABC transporter permease [Candidatus Methylomirabilis sp.]|nr:ABC transporter permease [Candidatus Methylomirabilis sp.]
MRGYLIRRSVQLVPVVLGISLVTFLIVRLAPGDPAALLVDTTLLSPAELARFRAELGLDAPWPMQFLAILKQLATGEIHSFRTGQPVLMMLAERLPITAVLIAGAIALSLLVGVPLGVLSARRPYSRLDDWLSVGALGGLSLPGFWLGLVLMWVFAGILRVLPATGTGPATRLDYTALDMIPYFVMPTVVLAAGLVPPIMRYTRSSMLEALAQDYVRTAWGKGLSESLVLYRHALRNALLPVVTVVGLLVPVLIGSTAVIESVFAMPGIGRLVVEAALNRDYPTIMTLNLLTAAAVLVSTLVVDVLYAVLDPRIELP